MRKMLCLVLLVPLLAAAAGKTDLLIPQTVVLPDNNPSPGATVTTLPMELPPAGHGTDFVGIIETVGGTTFDWQSNGPSGGSIAVDPTTGIHVTWIFSADLGGTAPDRNMRYNFFDFASRTWSFIDPANFMNDGVNGYSLRTGYGAVDYNPSSGVGLLSAHTTTPLQPNAAKDAIARGRDLQLRPGAEPGELHMADDRGEQFGHAPLHGN